MESKNVIKNILIIDDDPIARMLARRNLEIAGYNGSIITAENGLIGLDILKKLGSETIVLLDLHMPQLDGLGVLQKLKEQNIKPITFMLSSSEVTEKQISKLGLAGVTGFLTKPIDQLKSKVILEQTVSLITV